MCRKFSTKISIQKIPITKNFSKKIIKKCVHNSVQKSSIQKFPITINFLVVSVLAY